MSVSLSFSDRDLLRWSEALAGIARTGLSFTQLLYEQERYEEVLHYASPGRTILIGARATTLF